jgi:alkylation response protein AidB-like acyl-CoA dehydrogenase
MDFDLSEEQRMWQSVVRDFAAEELRPAAAELDESAQFNPALPEKMGRLGLLGLNISEQFGGTGMSAVDAVVAIEELGWGDGGIALSVAAHNGLGCAPITLFGSEAQKSEWLPRLASGKDGLGALALTEPDAGSDLAGGLKTRAEQEGGEWVINGSKAWITNASLAPMIITLCRTSADTGTSSMSLIIVPTDTPGLHIHPPEKKMGVRASPTHALTYDGVRVPVENVLGAPGDGLRQTLQVLDGGRVGIAALAVGLARVAHEESIRYARERVAFGKPLTAHQAIQWMIADAAVQIDAARLLVYRAAHMKDRGEFFNREAAIAKLFATETAEGIARNAVQILGSYGYSQEYPVERIYRDARLMTIGEGTSEVQRMVIARRELGDE